jgi:hypothetical protein
MRENAMIKQITKRLTSKASEMQKLLFLEMATMTAVLAEETLG